MDHHTPDPDAPLSLASPAEARAYARQHLADTRHRLEHARARLDEHGPEATSLVVQVAQLEAQEREALATCERLGIGEGRG